MLYVKNISERLLLSILVFLIMAISIKKIDGAKEFITKNIYGISVNLKSLVPIYTSLFPDKVANFIIV